MRGLYKKIEVNGEDVRMKKRMVSVLLLAGMLSILFAFNVSGIENPKQWIVSIEDDGDFSTIQQAVDTASSGDIIRIRDGVYAGTVFVNKTLHIMGVNTSFCVIDGGGENGFVIHADEVVLSNCTIKNASIGLYVNGSDGVIRNCTLVNNENGIIVGSEAISSQIYNNNFVNNSHHCFDSGNSSTWNSSTTGNFWDTYTGSDNDNDGFGDTPFHITGDGNKDYFPLMNPITIPPVALFSFTPSMITSETEIVFVDESYDIDGFILSYQWDFGDGNSSTDINPTHQFMKAGTYLVSLQVTDNIGSTNVTRKNVTVLNVPPVAGFSFTPKKPTDVEQVLFKDTSSDIDGSIVNWTWDFGDNATSFEQNPVHQFSDDDIYLVRLTVEDDKDDTDSYAQSITVTNVAPVASFTFTFSNVTALVDQPVYFQDTSIDLDGSIVSREWYFGDKSNSSEKNPTHTYANKGSYTVSLSVTDDDGETASVTQQITVSDTIHHDEVITEFSLFDIIFVVFLVVMIILVIVLSKKYG